MFWKILDFIKEFDSKHGPFERVLDVGSRNINGSVKDGLSQNLDFIGIDMIAGKDVDIVLNSHNLLEYAKQNGWKPFDLITCCETLEHDVFFWQTVDQMKALVKPGGWLLVTTPSINFFRHDFPSDYYRFTESVYHDYIFKGWKNVQVQYYEDAGDPNKEKPNNTILGYAQKPI